MHYLSACRREHAIQVHDFQLYDASLRRQMGSLRSLSTSDEDLFTVTAACLSFSLSLIFSQLFVGLRALSAHCCIVGGSLAAPGSV